MPSPDIDIFSELVNDEPCLVQRLVQQMENNIKDILNPFLFKLNTQETQYKIKNIIESFFIDTCVKQECLIDYDKTDYDDLPSQRKGDIGTSCDGEEQIVVFETIDDILFSSIRHASSDVCQYGFGQEW